MHQILVYKENLYTDPVLLCNRKLTEYKEKLCSDPGFGTINASTLQSDNRHAHA
jgi:hypothetical protein